MEAKRQKSRSEPRRSRSNATQNPTVMSDQTAPAANEPTKPRDTDQRHALIAEKAYYRAEQRGFTAGHELDDWLEAEAEVDVILASLEERGSIAAGRTH